MKIKEVIENLYSVFSKYTASNMYHCDCGCIDEDDVKKLASKKLMELNEDDFSSYHGSAISTWGDVKHYKHFLPRVIEVHHQKKGKGLIGIYEIIQKLEYAKWHTWDDNEIKVIKDFIIADWNDFVNEKESNIVKEHLEHYMFFFSLSDLLNIWKLTKTKNGLKNFVTFFYHSGSELINKGFKLNDHFFVAEFNEFIHNENALEELEKDFFKMDEIHKEYAEKVSIVIQMIEQENKLIDNR